MLGGDISAGGEVASGDAAADGEEETGFVAIGDLEDGAPEEGAIEAAAAEEGAADAGAAAAVVALSSGNSTKESHSSSVLQSDADVISSSVTSFPVTLAKTSLRWVTSCDTITTA